MSKASPGGRGGRCPPPPKCSFKQTHHWVKHLQEADGAGVLLLLLSAPLSKHTTDWVKRLQEADVLLLPSAPLNKHTTNWVKRLQEADVLLPSAPLNKHTTDWIKHLQEADVLLPSALLNKHTTDWIKHLQEADVLLPSAPLNKHTTDWIKHLQEADVLLLLRAPLNKHTTDWIKHLQEADVLLLLRAPLNKHTTDWIKHLQEADVLLLLRAPLNKHTTNWVKHLQEADVLLLLRAPLNKHTTDWVKQMQHDTSPTQEIGHNHRTADGIESAASNPCWNSGRIFFSRVDFLRWLLFRYPFHPRVTTVARKRSRSFCQKCRWQVTAKHAYTLRMWLCMKWHGAWLYGVHRTCAEMAAVSCGTSHASAVSTPLRWIFKKRAIKASHSCRTAYKRSESAQESGE